jgi:hypothetical protein
VDGASRSDTAKKGAGTRTRRRVEKIELPMAAEAVIEIPVAAVPEATPES